MRLFFRGLKSPLCTLCMFKCTLVLLEAMSFEKTKQNPFISGATPLDINVPGTSFTCAVDDNLSLEYLQQKHGVKIIIAVVDQRN